MNQESQPAFPHRSARSLPARRLAHWASALVLLSTLGCGNTLYAIQANHTASRLAEAKELGAEHYAPYEFTMASEYAEKAQTEAAEADYSDARELSARAQALAETAITLSRDAHREARP